MPFVYVSHPMHATPMYGRRHCSPCSPGGCNLLALAGLFLFLPMILRVVACLFLWALPVLSFIAMAKFATCVCAEMCSDDDTPFKSAAASKSACPCPSSACPRPERDTAEVKSCGRKETGTVREALAKEAAASDDVVVRIAAPGVRPSDLTVSVVDGTLTVKGETTVHGETFRVERSLHVPRGVELEKATCAAADGIVTLTIPRKHARSIPINATPIHVVQPSQPVTDAEVVTASDQSVEATSEEKRGDASDADEWVEMPREAARAKSFSDS